ncbi:cupin domain-containing protein [Natrarchaeobius oligotrophus]|uniref:Cupin domain-containing protein n=1 Tax=Natrarchaeobius chitinivorans TaxID=1679083 RepID=A0A3N6MAC5_NATCH|nr:cupin domain-containing protein [Natrarchaeobius chitinivorans]RQG97614.1 cupin domain-containing protein [Natrarchaeobius chitinivorans]
MEPINESDLEWSTLERDDVGFRRKQLGAAVEGDQLGCSLYELPAGRRSWPYHYHTANEEAMFVLSGTGTLRLDGESYPIGEGDYAAFPADESGGHRVVNDGDEPLRYLAISTMVEPDVTVYPETEKLGVFVGSPPGGDERSLHGFYRIDDDVDYWED